jgi:hypothetical protein
MKLWIVMAVLGLGLAAHAEDKKAAPNVRYQKTTVYDFEDDTIEGDLTRPDGEYVEARKQVKHSNLIRIRDNFKDEVMQSVGDL